jgi:threonylcarbamoyladenosine tRNA methylthiotransferase MtaB
VTGQTFQVTNFGCRASQSEGAAIEQELLDASAQRADSPLAASVVVLNTCTVTAEADKEVRQLIRRIAARNPAARIVVTGCYAQRAPEEIAALPHVSHVVGNSHKATVGRLTLSLLGSEPPVEPRGRAEIFCSDIFLPQELHPEAHAGSAGRTRAILKIQDGCNANCSFCIIPSVRGRSRSMDGNAVATQVRSLVAAGYKEVVLSGIHLGSYGRDREDRTSLLRLVLRILTEIPALEHLRLSSIEPLEVTPELVECVAGHPRLAPHFHIPLQSGSPRILREMRRPYTPSYYSELTRSIRRRIPDAAIGADVMVGFPGETDDEFMETYRLIEDSTLTYLHVFPFSARPGTPAAELNNPVPAHVAQFRAKALRALIAGKNVDFRSEMVGRPARILILQPGEGLTANFVRVHVPAQLRPNQWVTAHIDALENDGVRSSGPQP